MKNLGLLFALLFASLSQLPAQVTVEVMLDQDQFLPGETLPAIVRITNRSGQTIHFGTDNEWLKFDLEAQNGSVVVKSGQPLVKGEFVLESSQRAIKRVDLTPCFNLTRPGRYAINATVSLNDWKQRVTSPPKGFDIIQGAKLWEQDFGVPQAGGKPEMRKYMLQQANYLRKGLMLYFLLSDAAGKPLKVFPIGPFLSFGNPDKQVDKISNLHVLYQDAPKGFDYSVFNPDGQVIIHQKYDYFPNRPVLKADDAGNIVVMGGTRHITVADVPNPTNTQDNAGSTTP